VLPKGSNVDPRSVISARVEMVELLGGEALVHLSSGGVDLTARLPVPLPATDGELRLTPTTVHFFDGETGDRLDA
jgi:hypothetical protein